MRKQILYHRCRQGAALFIIFICGALLEACSTMPISTQTGSPVPNERIYHAKYVKSTPASKAARVSFFRDTGFFGSGCSHDVYINNKKVFTIRPGEFIHLNLASGGYFFRVETGAGLCPNIAISKDVILKAEDHIAYRILLPSDGSLRLTRIK